MECTGGSALCFLGAGKWSRRRGAGGTDGAQGKQEKEEGEEEEVGGRREGGRGSRPGDRGDARSAGLGAARSLGGRRLHRAARGKEMARLAAGGRPGAPRAPLPGGGRPRVRRRHARRCAPVEGQSGQGLREDGLGGGGVALAPSSSPAPADSQPTFFPSPAPSPGRRGGGCSPLCNRRSAFFTVHLSHPYMTIGKTTTNHSSLTRRTFVGKVMYRC